MTNYTNIFLKKLIHRIDYHLKFHFLYFQDLFNTKVEQAKRKYFEYISHTSYRTKTSTLKSTGHS